MDALFRKLEHATFSQREALAAEAAGVLAPDALDRLAAALEHPQLGVRLGVIEILRHAGHRASLQRLLAHAQAHDGDDRVFAIRALARLAGPEDDVLREPARRWLASSDPFVEAQARQLARALELAEPARPPPREAAATDRPAAGRPAGSTREPLEALVAQLLAARGDAARRELVGAIEERGAPALAAAARVVLPKASADAVAFVCRALIRHASAVPAPARLVALLEAARVRLAEAPIASTAIDDAAVALGGQRISPALLARIGELDRVQLEVVVDRLGCLPAPEVALHVPALLDALARDGALWSAFGPILAHAAPHVRDTARAELRRLAEVALAELRKGKHLDPVALVSLGHVLARICEPGEPLARPLHVALERLSVAEASRALAALCARLATEEAARVLVAMLRDPLAEARTAARDALDAWQSPWVAVEGRDAPALVPRYADERGEPLVRRGDRLVVAASGEEYVLDPRGRPTRGSETELGGCLCCAPPRALVRRRGDGLRCPSTNEGHLRDGSRVVLEREHALGRCARCDSVRPRVRDGARVICLDCGAGARPGAIVLPAPGQPAPPSEHAGRGDEAFPKPPTAAELEHVAPHIRAAITASVFLHGRDGQDRWNGSGIIIAREGNHVAILTNRHVVESDDRRLCALTAMTVTDETIAATAVWRANRGVDLALVEARLDNPGSAGAMALGTGAVLVGAAVFAVGNPLGLAWSYTSGTLSAIRHWTTQDGQSLRILQTDAAIAPGSSGGGLFHGDGHLIGVMSFLSQGHAGDSAHFALSVDAIRDAFTREDVRWRGHALARLPP